MKFLTYSFLSSILLFLSSTSMKMETDLLTQYKWKNCILVVFSETNTSPLFEKQIQLFDENIEELADRDLIIFQVFEKSGITPNRQSISNTEITQLKERFDFNFEKNNEFAVFLVGKDGGTKLTSKNEMLNIEKLCATIDAMPMRQAEMKR